MSLSNDDGYQVTVETDYDKLVHFSTHSSHVHVCQQCIVRGWG